MHALFQIHMHKLNITPTRVNPHIHTLYYIHKNRKEREVHNNNTFLLKIRKNYKKFPFFSNYTVQLSRVFHEEKDTQIKFFFF